MSTLSLLPLSLLESEGAAILQQAADAALGPCVLTVTSDSNGISTGLKLSSGQTVNIDGVTIGSGGLSGRIFVDGLDANPLSATLFDGFTIALTAFDVTLANGSRAQEAGLQQRSAIALDAVKAKLQPDPLPDSARQISPAVAAANAVINARGGDSAIATINPIIAGELLHLAEEQAAAAAATQLWFRPLYPKTRYTLDVVAGPLRRGQGRDLALAQTGSAGSLAAVLSATDAIGLLAALKAYFAYEDALTTLERVQFTTSRYKTFTDQMANATGQLTSVATATPLRHYATAISAQDWVNTSAGLSTYQTAKENYLIAVRALNDLVAIFNPLADNLLASPGLSGSGAGDLVVDRAATTQTWSSFQQASSAIFDGLIAALGLPQLASCQKPLAVPDTEISLITNTSGNTIEALLIESPEPLPWLRIWQWIQMTPAWSAAGGLTDLFVAWNSDGTRGLIVPTGQPHGLYSLGIDFQGNVGAQAPCITLDGVAVAETVTLGPVSLGPLRRRFPIREFV
ncbi:hypothetical protein [Granulicella aggregans]|uniref:hypothetical protein n=1 Tax=Granulicella aggregans TaxID=474949 RepID=UPI0021DF44DA|nr:hypothetical protein [Granulicella aggregans]